MRETKGPTNAVLLSLGVVVILAAAFAVLAGHLGAGSSPRESTPPTGLPASVPSRLASLMSLGSLPRRTAPSFTLTDQRGRRVSLASLRGRVVVLEFMDPHCTDVCPIVSKELLDAQRALGEQAGEVAFVSINVNRFHTSVGEVAAFTGAHGLGSLRSWHFVTGPGAALARVWHGYGVEVVAPSPDADVQHTSLVYFIDRSGTERYVANHEVLHTSSGRAYLPGATVTAWGRGIALVAASLLDAR